MDLMNASSFSLSQIILDGIVLVGTGLCLFYIIRQFQTSSKSPLPIINGRKIFEFGNTQAKRRYKADAKGLLDSGFKKVRISPTVQGVPVKLTADRAKRSGCIPMEDPDLFSQLNMLARFTTAPTLVCQKPLKLKCTPSFLAWRDMDAVTSLRD